jgi:hypothetical protein
VTQRTGRPALLDDRGEGCRRLAFESSLVNMDPPRDSTIRASPRRASKHSIRGGAAPIAQIRR